MKARVALNLLSGLLLSVLIISCEKTEIPPVDPPTEVPVEKPDLVFYALTSGAKLSKFNAKDPENAISSVQISGTLSAEIIQAIDFRPATGQLYGIGSSSRIYVINPATGVAREIGTGPFTPALPATIVAFDFNPTVDRIRVVTGTGMNLRVNPETGAVAATDGVVGSAAMVSAVAYTNNMAGAATTTLYDIDVKTQKLFKQDPPNNGTLVEVGSLQLNISNEEGGFDIAPNGIALGVYPVDGKSTLFQVDLTTGKATALGNLGSTNNYNAIAIPTNPVAYAVDEDNALHIFNPENFTGTVSKPITGLQSSEMILGIDFRPANGQLFALGSSNRIYTINVATGAAAVVGSELTTPLAGTSFGFDFNPTVDRIRVVSNTGQNLRIVPTTAAIAATDGNLNPGTPAVSAAAYTNNFAGATTTMLFDIDSQTDKLYRQDPPNAGTLVEIGNLGIDVESANGFDIGGVSGKAWAILKTGAMNKIYSINISTGLATPMMEFPKTVRGFAVGLGF
ncbi:MAG: DUF4394 domain-containing protein [Chitinophagaceae bacterium]|nr:DUF4394 domain-containing protein [Chitinophagaceae bacterium]